MKIRYTIYAVSVLIAVCLIICLGLFLFDSENREGLQPGEENAFVTEEITSVTDSESKSLDSAGGKDKGTSREDEDDFPEAVQHEKLQIEIAGHEQAINLLKIDLNGAVVWPALSFGLIYGFEKLSEMTEREGAYAAVNGGFFHEYGEPAGMIMVNGEILTLPTGSYPVLVLGNGTAKIMEYTCQMEIISEYGEIMLDDLNNWENPSAIIAYSPVYGTTNRAGGENITIIIKNGFVESIEKVKGETAIPHDGMLITIYPPYVYEEGDLPLKPGDRVRVEYSPGLGDSSHAYECGAWLIKDGKNVAPKSDPWVGVLTNRDPRTAVGVMDNGNTLIFVTVDGRQPGYSAGLTADELADFMTQTGVKNAAMLDGGASTEMIVAGEIVNRTNTGRERNLAGAFMVKYKER